MATLAETTRPTALGDETFFLRCAIAMALLVAFAFSFQLAMGRSTFASPALVHAHAIVFMGWVVLYLMQNIFVASDRMWFHRRLGWIALPWMIAMIVLGVAVTVAMVQRGHVPFFFRPLQFLIFDPMTVFTFAGLTLAAILLRRRTEWHRRLHFCAMALLLAPAFGRLLPLPLLQPWAWEASFAAAMIFPLLGVARDVRRSGRIHPAWKWGIGATLGCLVATEAITYSPVGTAIYRAATEGTEGAQVAPLDFAPPPPPGTLMTGRPASS